MSPNPKRRLNKKTSYYPNLGLINLYTSKKTELLFRTLFTTEDRLNWLSSLNEMIYRETKHIWAPSRKTLSK